MEMLEKLEATIVEQLDRDLNKTDTANVIAHLIKRNLKVIALNFAEFVLKNHGAFDTADLYEYWIANEYLKNPEKYKL